MKTKLVLYIRVYFGRKNREVKNACAGNKGNKLFFHFCFCSQAGVGGKRGEIEGKVFNMSENNIYKIENARV